MRRALLPVIGFAVLAIGGRASAAANDDGIASWHQVESVLTSPRCLNCHTVTDYPRQGDDRHRHNFQVIRGAHGMGAPAFSCAACHHDANNDASGVPVPWAGACRPCRWRGRARPACG